MTTYSPSVRFMKRNKPSRIGWSNAMTTEEIDFLKSRMSQVLNQIDYVAQELKAKAMILKQEGDKDNAQKFFNELKKNRNEYKKIAEIQRKLKRGFR